MNGTKVVMRRVLSAIVLALCAFPLAHAQDGKLAFDGEMFFKKHDATTPQGYRIIEFVRGNEILNNWTKLIGYHKYPEQAGNDPKDVALKLARLVKTTNPQAPARVITNPTTSEAIVDFVTWLPNGNFMEFNVFRFAVSNDGRNVVAFQFACRFTPQEVSSSEQLRQKIASWVDQAAKIDMAPVLLSLAAKP